MLIDIERRKSAESLYIDPDTVFAFRVRSVKMFSLADSMSVNADALFSLQILRSESHPNAQMQEPDKASVGTKESLSVYGLFHSLASTPQGKAKLRQLFLQPSTRLDIIGERHGAITQLLRPENTLVVDSAVKRLKKIKNIRTSLTQLRRGVLHPPGQASIKRGVLPTIQNFAAHSCDLLQLVKGFAGGEDVAIIAKVSVFVRTDMCIYLLPCIR